jgi:hypothetical protein
MWSSDYGLSLFGPSPLRPERCIGPRRDINDTYHNPRVDRSRLEALFIPFRGVYFVSYGVGARRGSRN